MPLELDGFNQGLGGEMQNSNLDIWPGSRVLVFDSRLYKDDVTTPLSFTKRPATVVCRYGRLITHYLSFTLGPYPDLIDVMFDHREGVSKGHFTNYAKLL